MGWGLGALICYYCGVDAAHYGYSKIVGCAINPMAKSMYEKPFSIVFIFK